MSKKQKTGKYGRSVNDAKAKLRGIFAAARNATTYSSENARGIDWNGRRSVFQFSLTSGLSKARGEVPVNSYGVLLNWIEQQKSSLLPATFKTAKPTLASLSHVHKTKGISLASEIYWLCARLCSPAEQIVIRRFLEIRDQIDSHFWEGDYSTIQNLLKIMGEELGQSIWIVETKLSLEQVFHGLESQKRLLNSIKAEAGRGFVYFLSHRMSMRSEPAVTTARFAANLDNHISARKIEDAMAEYLRYKLCHRMPDESDGIAAVMRFLQNHSAIDIYEGLLSFVECAGKSKEVDELIPFVLQALGVFGNFDKRLIKINALSSDILPTDIKLSQPKSLSKLIDGDVRGAYRDSIKSFHIANGRDVFQLYVKSQAASFTELPALSRLQKGPPHRRFPKLLAHVIARTSDAESAYSLLDSMLRNLHVIPSCKAFAELALKEHDPLRVRNVKNRNDFAVNNESFSPLDLPSRFEHDFYVKTGDANCQAREFIRIIKGNPEKLKGIAPDAEKLAEVFRDYYRNDPAQLLGSLVEINDPVFRGKVHDRSVPLIVDAYISIGNLGAAITLAATAIVVNSVHASILPLAEIVNSNVKWPDIRQFASDISLSIVLDQCYKAKPSDSLATLRRTAVDTFVRLNSLSGPSQVAELEYEREKIVYFLRNLCIPSILDMCRCIRGTKAVQEERRKVLAVLIELDTSNAANYEDEILLISSNLRIREGLRVVDGSRVHVDEEGIARWAHSELQESLTRYKSLVEAGVGVAANLDELVREYTSQGGNRGLLEVPKNEADDLLVATLWQLRDKFLFDKPHGLNSYLSKRVRHNSIAGYLRGALEAENLITSLLAGEYKKNSFWAERLRLHGLTGSEIDASLGCLHTFGVKFDILTNHLKNSILHIKSPENPTGIIELPLLVNVVHLARSSLQSNAYSMGNLLDLSFAGFWRTLEPSLLRVREIFRQEQKHKFVQLFDDLLADIVKVTGRDRQCHELTTAIKNASTDLQRLMDRAADWFFKRQGLLSKYSYSLDEIVDVSLESAMARHKSCRLSIDKDVESPTQFRADSLSAVADIFLVVVGNISEHSGCQDDAKLKIFARQDEKADVIHLRFESSASASFYDKNYAGVEAAKTEIARGNYLEKSSKDTNSGLCKVASIVKLNSSGMIDFGFVHPELFYLDIDLPLEMQQMTVPDLVLEES